MKKTISIAALVFFLSALPVIAQDIRIPGLGGNLSASSFARHEFVATNPSPCLCELYERGRLVSLIPAGGVSTATIHALRWQSQNIPLVAVYRDTDGRIIYKQAQEFRFSSQIQRNETTLWEIRVPESITGQCRREGGKLPLNQRMGWEGEQGRTLGIQIANLRDYYVFPDINGRMVGILTKGEDEKGNPAFGRAAALPPHQIGYLPISDNWGSRVVVTFRFARDPEGKDIVHMFSRVYNVDRRTDGVNIAFVPPSD